MNAKDSPFYRRAALNLGAALSLGAVPVKLAGSALSDPPGRSKAT